MSVPGGFFEVTGKPQELDRIYDGIAANDGRLTADDSMSLDLWLEMKEEWFRLHDAAVIAAEAAASTTERRPTIADAAKELGLDLLPWQLELAERFQRGEKPVVNCGQRAGHRTFRRVLERWHELTESERRRSA